MIRTEICDILGIKYPIIQGGMAWIADASLASAVSNAGGLGLISAMNADSAWLKKEIRKAREMTDKPFGVNIMLMSPFAAEVAQAVIDEGVKVVTTGAGNPARYMEAWLKAGLRVIPVVPSTAIARMVERSGATAVIAEGGESGGHVGDLTTMTLVPQVCDAVKIPVIAAGGIADGRGIAASFMLGAIGVQVGTRFLVAKECNVHQVYKDKILKAKDIDTIVTGRRLGHPVRSLKTPFSRAFFEKEYDASISDEELEKFGVGALRLAAVEGDEKNGCFLAGQCASMVKKEQTAQEIITEMFAEAEQILEKAGKWVTRQ
jgi:enoyl-[acyl-carrier protein] reductase II